MTFSQVLSLYISLNVLITVGFLILFCVKKLSLSAKDELRFHYTVLLLIFSILVVLPLLPHEAIFSPIAKIGTLPSQALHLNSTVPANISTEYIRVIHSSASIETRVFRFFWAGLALSIFLVGFFRLFRDIRSLLKIQRRSFLVRKIKRVSIYINDDIAVPFSYCLLNQAQIVIPSSFLEKKVDYKIALMHELQHHRQHDTKWVYIIWFLKIVCWIHPLVHLWARWISQLQEYACDEALLGQQKVDSQAYARCLIEVAEKAMQQKHNPICAMGFIFASHNNILKGRIEKMLSLRIHRTQRMKNSIRRVFVAAFLGILASSAYAAQGLVQDEKISMSQAKEMAKIASKDSEYPIVVNESVLKYLNKYVGTANGKKATQEILHRMSEYQKMIEAKLSEYKVPKELMAVPMIESGFKNLASKGKVDHGAGLWMFITPTARKYGMQVDGKKDERLNTEQETEAAMRYIVSNHKLFNDWALSMLAYNMGEGSVQKGIAKTGSRDPWVLYEKGYKGDDYLPKLTAAILILKNQKNIFE